MTALESKVMSAPSLINLSEIAVARRSRRSSASNRWSTVRKIGLVISHFLLSNRAFYAFLGVLNSRTFSINTIFLVYPGSPDLYHGPSHRLAWKYASWRPTLIGLFRHAGSWGLTFAIASTESEIKQPANAVLLTGVCAQMDQTMRAVRAHEVRFAGIIPSILAARGAPTAKLERASAVAAALRAEAFVRSQEQIDEAAPVILLGASGFVGRELARRLAHRNAYAVDVGRAGGNFPNGHSFPSHLHGNKALLINVTRASTLELYVEMLWAGLVILNEAYPAPSRHILRKLSDLNCKLYHIAGAVGDAYPSFPGPYAGAIPCCAANITGETELVVRRLV